MDINQVRLQNYRVLIEQFKNKEAARGEPERGYLNRFGAFVGISPRYLSHINNGRKNVGDATARQIEHAFKLPHGWMDHDHLAGPVAGSKAEREYVELALRLFRESPLDAQSVLLRYMSDRLMMRSGARTEKDDETGRTNDRRSVRAA